MNDTDYMGLAIKLAQQGTGWTSPNPLVGAVLVKEGRIIGQGWHRRCGGLHAEREALAAVHAPPAPERRPGLFARLFGWRKG